MPKLSMDPNDTVKVRYRLYHSAQEGYRHPKESLRFVFCPEYPFKPLGLIIFDPGKAIVERLITGIEDQLLYSIPASEFSIPNLTISQLEMLTKSTAMQSILSGMGVFYMTLPSINIGTCISLDVNEPVGIVAFWGVERVQV